MPEWFSGARRLLLALFTALLVAALVGCSSTKDDTDTGDDSGDAGAGDMLPPPTATIQINYGHPNDRLVRATVTKFFAAEVIGERELHPGRNASMVRFDGGVPIWEMKGDESVVGRLSELGKSLALKQVEYGKVPKDFLQVIPDEGPPEPLDRGAYYVFEIDRASGSVSYQAVKVLADGSLEAYNAQPRAGTSYLLCCNIASDFPEPVVVPDQTAPADSSESSSPDSNAQPSGGDANQ
ncbi:MAG TPA: hypothetical protein VEJ86_10770 [Candidatus Binataceae bacterium]|nr:hypothetical protein [Candidatus Binataceae bacterium]